MLFFLLKGLAGAGVSKREVAGEEEGGGGVRFENGLADVKLNGLQGFHLDLF